MAEGDGDTDELSQVGPFFRECGLTVADLTKPVAGKVLAIKNGLILEIVKNIPSNGAKDATDILLALAHVSRFQYSPG